MSEIAVMDYATAKITVMKLPTDKNGNDIHSEAIELWLSGVGYRLSDIYYMVAPGISVSLPHYVRDFPRH